MEDMEEIKKYLIPLFTSDFMNKLSYQMRSTFSCKERGVANWPKIGIEQIRAVILNWGAMRFF